MAMPLDFRQRFIAAVKEHDWSEVISHELAAIATEILGPATGAERALHRRILHVIDGHEGYGLDDFDIEDFPNILDLIEQAAQGS